MPRGPRGEKRPADVIGAAVVEVTVDRRQGNWNHATLRFAGRKTTVRACFASC